MSVLVEGAAESVASADVQLSDPPRIGDRDGSWVQGCALVECPVRAVGVVVVLEFPQCMKEMALVPDQRSVEEFASAGAYPAFHYRVHPRYPYAGEHDSDPGAGEDLVEQLWVLPVPVPGSGAALGSRAHPTREWAVQQDRNLAADLGTRTFDAVFQAEELEILNSAPQAPRMNAHCERVIGSIRREALDHVLIMNETHARHVLAAYQQHYNEYRPSLGVDPVWCSVS
jgi:hypothetical protein